MIFLERWEPANAEPRASEMSRKSKHVHRRHHELGICSSLNFWPSSKYFVLPLLAAGRRGSGGSPTARWSSLGPQWGHSCQLKFAGAPLGPTARWSLWSPRVDPHESSVQWRRIVALGGFEEEDDRVDTGSLLRSALPQLPDLTGLRFPQVISSTYAGSADLQANREVLMSPKAVGGDTLGEKPS